MKLILHSRIACVSFALSFALVGSAAHAAPISKCDAAKKKCIGKYAAAVLGCHAKAGAKGVALEAACVAKAAAKITGGGDGCFDKLDAKTPNDCAASGDASLLMLHADALIRDVVTAVDPAYPTPTRSKCGAARKKCVAKKVAGLMGCSAGESKDGAGDPACAPKVMDKFGGAKGCDAKAVASGIDCLGTATTTELESLVDDWAVVAATLLQNPGPSCGNGVVEPGESCDPVAPAHRSTCGADFACGPTCNCACPTKAHLVPDPTSASSRLDIGWTGLAHETPLPTGTDVTLAVSCENTSRPCGACTVSGPIANEGATEIRNQRCTNDTSIRCTDDGPCAADGGTCEFFLGSTTPLVTSGVAICIVNQFHGPISGTLSLGGGNMRLASMLTSRVYVGPGSIDTPCAFCAGDATFNDDLQGGTCVGGAREGLACDANATVPSRPDFGATSLDCPPTAGSLVAALPIDASSATEPVTKTLSADSPRCGYPASGRCLCDTCNNADAQPCSSNADCPPSGGLPGLCGGRRCFGGLNAGGPCASATACPGGGVCTRAGEPSRPSVCQDENGPTPCVDADGDGSGECVGGPLVTACTAPHTQRGCLSDADCTPGTCATSIRKCFPTGGFDQMPGTNTLVAYGQADVPVRDEASPVLASTFCIGATPFPAANLVLGLPGPARASVETHLTLHP